MNVKPIIKTVFSAVLASPFYKIFFEQVPVENTMTNGLLVYIGSNLLGYILVEGFLWVMTRDW